MFVRFFALPIQFSPKLGSKIENTTLSLGKDKNKCHKMYFQQIRSKPNLLRWKCHKIAAKSNQEIHLRNILHRKMRIEDIFIFANSVHTSQNSSTIFTCVSVRDQAWHLHLSPPYDVLDHTNHIFSESLSSDWPRGRLREGFKNPSHGICPLGVLDAVASHSSYPL